MQIPGPSAYAAAGSKLPLSSQSAVARAGLAVQALKVCPQYLNFLSASAYFPYGFAQTAVFSCSRTPFC